MKKNILFLLMLALLLMPVSAKDRRIVDDADLLKPDQEAALSAIADRLSETYQIDIVILTVRSLEGLDPESFADSYYDTHDYGYGENHSGILFLLSMEYRDWAISTTGDGLFALTDYGVQEIFSYTAPYLANDQWYKAFSVYLENMEYYLKAFYQGKPVDGTQDPYDGPGSYIPPSGDKHAHYDKPLSWSDVPGMVMLSLGLGAAVGAIAILVMRRGMNTVRKQSGAGEYAPKGLQLTMHVDQYLYSNVRRVPRSDNNPSGGGSGGGSRVHIGSSGRSHGGGHGKF